jgi:uncharacterized membrane protein
MTIVPGLRDLYTRSASARIEAPAAELTRVPMLDVARGTALLAMFSYHFAWDLNYYGLISAAVGEGGSLGWVLLARSTAGSFLFLVGVSLVLATRRGFRARPFLRRLALVGGAAVLLTAVTWWLTPEDFIYFGILHCIAVSSVLALPFLHFPVWIVLVAALVCLAVPSLFAAPAFDAAPLRWLGLMTYFPDSIDYEPLLPWFGVVLLGIAAARSALPTLETATWARGKPASGGARLLGWAGRHSLGIYLLHQPVFLTALYLVAMARA